MAYEAGHAQVVLFGGLRRSDSDYLGDTWTWDGTDWTQRTPTHSPSARYAHAMAYDAAHAHVVLFGGYSGSLLGDTWTWDGTDWTQRTPTHSPSVRYAHAMAYDAAQAGVVLFGGGGHTYLGDTWTWNGTDWGVPFQTSATVRPTSGPPGTHARIHGWGYGAFEKVQLTFIDTVDGTTKLGIVETNAAGAFVTQVTIPADATPGEQAIKAKGRGSGSAKRKTFTVT
jgi:hypothetical protein